MGNFEKVGNFIKGNNVKNVNVDEDIYNNVNVENLVKKISEAVDKPRAIGQILTEELNAPGNLKFYIKLAYMHPPEFLFECVSIAKEAYRIGKIDTTLPAYFYGIVRMRHNEKK